MTNHDFYHLVVFGILTLFAMLGALGDLLITGKKLGFYIDRVFLVGLWFWAMIDYHVF